MLGLREYKLGDIAADPYEEEVSAGSTLSARRDL